MTEMKPRANTNKRFLLTDNMTHCNWIGQMNFFDKWKEWRRKGHMLISVKSYQMRQFTLTLESSEKAEKGILAY